MLLTRETFKAGRWSIGASAALLAAVAFTYHGVYAPHTIGGTSGGSRWGLTYGITGTALIVFAMLLLAKKTWRTVRVGSAYAWLQGHVWLGLVSYPVIWYHAGGRLGGPLTWWLMVVFTVVWVSGVVGLVLQNLVPRVMFQTLPDETIYAQIDRVARENLKEARRLVRVKSRSGDSPGLALLEFYERQVRPFLAGGLRPAPAGWFFQSRTWSRSWLGPPLARTSIPPPRSAFAGMRTRYPGLFDQLVSLERLVEQRRQHLRQKRLHWVLHGWLLLHVPCSVVLSLLIPLHAVLALRY